MPQFVVVEEVVDETGRGLFHCTRHRDNGQCRNESQDGNLIFSIRLLTF